MKESKIILLESSVKGNKEPFPPKTTHSPCCSFPAAESVIISHVIRWDQLLLFPQELMQKLDRKQTEGKDIWKVGREFPKIHLHFGTSFCSSTHAIDNRNLCKQGKATLPIISVSSDRIEQEMHWELAAGKAIFLCNKSAAWHKHKNLMAAEIKMPQRHKDTE